MNNFMVQNQVHVNIPFNWLYESYLKIFIEKKLNPEIGFDAKALDSFTSGIVDCNEIALKFHKSNLAITLHGPFMDLSPGSPDPYIRKITKYRFKQLLKLIPIFKPKSIVCHTGYDVKRYGFIYDEWSGNLIDTFLWFGEEVIKKGSKLMIENVYEKNPSEIKFLFKKLEHLGVSFCFDIGHQSAFSDSPLEDWVKELGAYIGQLHLHDNFGKKDDHIAMGKGIINFPKFFDMLKIQKKTIPILTLEPHREEELWPSLVYLDKMWPWEKG
ncbi:MAG: sugar phosphate isomerase/epimerase [Desulfobacterales bacterium]|nr:sugar phosphate isomerase/epimerase [Desulfobacterales bacterium]